MSEPIEQGEITVLLRRLASGDRGVRDEFFRLVYPELRKLAASYLARERSDHTLQPTALVNEAFLRMPDVGMDWHGRAHFFALAASVMRHVLIDHARLVLAAKRAAGKKVELSDVLVYDVRRPDHLLELDDALHRLARMQPRQAQIVEMRFFGGLTEDQIGDVLSLSSRTIKREWRIARAWLYAELATDRSSPSTGSSNPFRSEE